MKPINNPYNPPAVGTKAKMSPIYYRDSTNWEVEVVQADEEGITLQGPTRSFYIPKEWITDHNQTFFTIPKE